MGMAIVYVGGGGVVRGCNIMGREYEGLGVRDVLGFVVWWHRTRMYLGLSHG